MKAFLSYSLNDADQFVIPLISRRLQEQRFFVTTGSYKFQENLDYQTKNGINTSNLFIGLITNTGFNNQRVYNEWLHAINNRIPSILLVEDNYDLNRGLERQPNLIRFNRYNPEIAIEEINERIKKSQNHNNDLEDAAPWILGGLAIAALISMLSED